MTRALHTSFEEARLLTKQVCGDPAVIETVIKMASISADAFRKKHRLFFCGNGGSACDAMHAAEEFTGRFRKNRPALPAVAIADPAHLTCVGNDFGFEEIFSRYLEAHAGANDILVVLSTSGNSPNIIKAVEVGRQLGMTTIAFLGKGGGAVKGLCDMEIIIPSERSERIQELHMTLLHIVIEGIERELFPDLY